MSIKDNLIYQWIMNNKAQGIDADELINELKFVSYPYDKYGETVFSMKQGGWNVPLIENVSRDLHDGTRKGYEDTREFAEYLAKRMELREIYFNGVGVGYICPNPDCKKAEKFKGNAEFWQELIRTRKALDVAVDALKDFSIHPDNSVKEYARKTLEQIEHKEE